MESRVLKREHKVMTGTLCYVYLPQYRSVDADTPSHHLYNKIKLLRH